AEPCERDSARTGGAELKEIPTSYCRHPLPPNEQKLSQRGGLVKFQPVDISRSLRSSGSGLRKRSMRRSSQGTTTPAVPAWSWSCSAAAQDARSVGRGIGTHLSPAGSCASA